ncbi:MAG: hypothetical protein AB8C84_09365 [Oligoflexales bacterium]
MRIAFILIIMVIFSSFANAGTWTATPVKHCKHLIKAVQSLQSQSTPVKASAFTLGAALGAGIEQQRRRDQSFTKVECDHMCFKITTVLSPFIFRFPLLPIFSGRLVGSELYDYISRDPKDSPQNGLDKK